MTSPPRKHAALAMPSDLIPHSEVPIARQTSTFSSHSSSCLQFFGLRLSSISTTEFFLSNQDPWISLSFPKGKPDFWARPSWFCCSQCLTRSFLYISVITQCAVVGQACSLFREWFSFPAFEFLALVAQSAIPEARLIPAPVQTTQFLLSLIRTARSFILLQRTSGKSQNSLALMSLYPGREIYYDLAISFGSFHSLPSPNLP